MAFANFWFYHVLYLYEVHLGSYVSHDLGKLESHFVRSRQRSLEGNLWNAQILLFLGRVLPLFGFNYLVLHKSGTLKDFVSFGAPARVTKVGEKIKEVSYFVSVK